MKIQIAGLTKELESALEKEKVSFDDWSEDWSGVNECLEELGMVIDTEQRHSGSEYFITVEYRSEKIGKVIVLEYDAVWSFKSYAELAEYLVKLNDEARELESKLPQL